MLIRGPKDSYIELFMDLLRDQETPSEYDFWAAVWTIGAVVGRECYIDRPRAPIFFNWYVIVCAESGMTRKSTVINFAKDMIEGCLPEYAHLLQNKTTPEKLWWMMSEQSMQRGKSHVVINVSELVSFFGREGYAMGMPIMLTDLYDCPVRREGGGSLNYGSVPLINPFITFIAGSTPSWLIRAINPDVIEGGFTSRVIFVSSEHRKKLIFWPDGVSQPNVNNAKEYLRAIRDHAIKIKTILPTEEAKEFLSQWYRSRNYSSEAYLRSFESREDSHVLRLAGTLALSQLRSDIRVSEVELALYAISRAKKSGSRIFKEAALDLKLTNGLDKIREVLLRHGLRGIRSTELQMATRYHLKPIEYQGVMEILTDIGAVRQYLVPSKTRPTKYYVATTKILHPQKWNEAQLRSGIRSKAGDQPELTTAELPLEDYPALEDHRTSPQKLSQQEKLPSLSIDLDVDCASRDRVR